MKRALIFVLSIFFAAALIIPASAEPGVSAQSCILVHVDTGTVLYERGADDKRLIASTTKIMTALVALESCALDDVVRVTADCAGVEGSSAYLRAGESYTVEELLYGLMLVSGNDAALALAVHTAGSVEGFTALMNAKAKELGMTGTSFENPHGLDGENHYSTARDMAVLTAHCLQNPDFCRIVGTKSVTVDGQTYVNHNKLLWNCEGVTGVKTGYTMAAGRTLVSCCERNGTRLVCVTLDDPEDWKDHAALYDWAYALWRYEEYCGPEDVFELPLISAERDTIRLSPASPLSLLARYTDEAAVLRVELPRFVFAPVEAGEALGRAVLTRDGEELASCDILAAETVPASAGMRLSPPQRLWRFVTMAGRVSPYTYYLTKEAI